MTNEELAELYKPTGNSTLTAHNRRRLIHLLLHRDGFITPQHAIDIVGNTQIRNDLLYMAYRGEIAAWPPLPMFYPDRKPRIFGPLSEAPPSDLEQTPPMKTQLLLTEAANEAVTMAANEAVTEARKHLPFLQLSDEEVGQLVDTVYDTLADKVIEQATVVSSKYLKDVVSVASDAFWAVVVRNFPSKSGDLSVEQTVNLDDAMVAAVKEWLDNNVPTVRLTE